MNSLQTRRQFLKTIGTSAAALTLPACLSTKKRPNFLFILIDDLGWKDLACYGSRFYETPNIDKLASGGMKFTNAYVNAPNCAPSRASLLSGQYTPRHKIYTVKSSERGNSRLRKLIPIRNTTALSPQAVTLAKVLKSAGYTCASIGKWHLGEDPMEHGFDVNIGGNHFGHPPAGYFSPYKLPNLERAPDGEYLTDRLTDEAIKFIEDHRERPFFLYLSHYGVHTPLQAPEKIIEKYRTKQGSTGQSNPIYAAMIERVDASVGRIMEKLDELNLTGDTIIIFFSDNGGVRRITSMEPLRGGKGMLNEGGIRVPMIVRWNDRVKPGSTCEMPVIGVDFFPTILEMAGIGKPGDFILDGESIVTLLSGKSDLEREAIFWHFPAYLEGKNVPGARDAYFRTRPAGAVRLGDWKLIEYFEDGALELYNLAEDIGETTNLSELMPEKTKELLKAMREWRKSVNAPVPTKLNPEYDPNLW